MKTVFAYLLIPALLIFSGCSQPAVAPPPTTNTTPPPATVTPEDVDDARQVVFEYWDAFNSYDVERALTYLEESYRQEREEDIRSDIGRMRTFGTKLGVEEEAEPAITPEGKVEIRIKLGTPIGTRHVTYHLVKVNEEWKIGFSAEE